MNKTTSGFTIVELLIVIVVIAILATISIVAYTGMQQRARDMKRKDDLAKIVKAFQLWQINTGGNFDDMSAGSNGNEMGWFDEPYSGGYPSVSSVLIGAGYLNAGVVDPTNQKSPIDRVYAYMIANCTSASDQQRVILARLENPPIESLTEQLGETCNGTTFTNYTTTYNMNYGKMISLE